MGRSKKDFRPLNVRLDSNIHDRLEQYCIDSGQSKTVAVERAIAAYVQAFYKLQANIRESGVGDNGKENGECVPQDHTAVLHQGG